MVEYLFIFVIVLSINPSFSIDYDCSESGLNLAINNGGIATFNCTSSSDPISTTVYISNKDLIIFGNNNLKFDAQITMTYSNVTFYDTIINRQIKTQDGGNTTLVHCIVNGTISLMDYGSYTIRNSYLINKFIETYISGKAIIDISDTVIDHITHIQGGAISLNGNTDLLISYSTIINYSQWQYTWVNFTGIVNITACIFEGYHDADQGQITAQYNVYTTPNNYFDNTNILVSNLSDIVLPKQFDSFNFGYYEPTECSRALKINSNRDAGAYQTIYPRCDYTTLPLTSGRLTTKPLTTQPLSTHAALTSQSSTTKPLSTQDLTSQPLTTEYLSTQKMTTSHLTTSDSCSLRCWNGDCVESLLDCTFINHNCGVLERQCGIGLCSNTTCFDMVNNCSTGEKYCDQGMCIPRNYNCPEYDGCPIGTIKCPNGYNCTESIEQCFCDGSSKYECFDGTCTDVPSSCAMSPESIKPIEKNYTFLISSDSGNVSILILSEGLDQICDLNLDMESLKSYLNSNLTIVIRNLPESVIRRGNDHICISSLLRIMMFITDENGLHFKLNSFPFGTSLSCDVVIPIDEEDGNKCLGSFNQEMQKWICSNDSVVLSQSSKRSSNPSRASARLSDGGSYGFLIDGKEAKTTSNYENSGDKGNTFHTWQIVLVLIAIVVFIVAAISIVVYMNIKRRRELEELRRHSNIQTEEMSSSSSTRNSQFEDSKYSTQSTSSTSSSSNFIPSQRK